MPKQAKHCPRCGARKYFWEYSPAAIRNMADYNVYSEVNPVDGVVCLHCNTAFVVRRLEWDDPYIVGDTEFEFIPKYCPNCGKELEQQ